MTTPAIPNSMADMDSAWLTEALKANGTIQKARVTSFRTESVGAGTGLMADLARVYLDYDIPEAGAPKTLIAKTPSSAPENLHSRRN